MPDGRLFLVLEFIDGVTLRSVMAKDPGGMDLRRAADLLRQIARALSAAHDAGVHHRDLKPENIMIRDLGDGQELAVIIDFGIATVLNSEVPPSSETMVAGSWHYMAPEQLAGRPEAASDICALGVIAFEIVTGSRPFRAGSAVELYQQQREGPKQGPCALRPDLPPAAAVVILKALSFDAVGRYGRATEFGVEFEGAIAEPSRAAGSEAEARNPQLQGRMLDVGMQAQVPIYEPAELVALIRRTESAGLKALVEIDPDFSIAEKDVRSRPFQVEFPRDQAGRAQSLDLTLTVASPDFEPTEQSKVILVRPDRDSEAYTFLLTPQHLGELRLTLEVSQGEVHIASKIIKTHAERSERITMPVGRTLVSIPIEVLVDIAGALPTSAPLARQEDVGERARQQTEEAAAPAVSADVGQHSGRRAFVASLLADAERKLAQRRFPEAIRLLESALQLDESDTVRARLEDALRERDNELRKIKRVLSLGEASRGLVDPRQESFHEGIRSARAAMHSGDLARARSIIDSLASACADLKGAPARAKVLSEELARRERRTEIAGIAREAGDLARQKQFESAHAKLDAGLARYPGNPELQVALENLLRPEAREALLEGRDATAGAREKEIEDQEHKAAESRAVAAKEQERKAPEAATRFRAGGEAGDQPVSPPARAPSVLATPTLQAAPFSRRPAILACLAVIVVMLGYFYLRPAPNSMHDSPSVQAQTQRPVLPPKSIQVPAPPLYKPIEEIRWRGSLGPGESLAIHGATCSQGRITAGELPGTNVQVNATRLPQGLQIAEGSSTRNGFSLRLRNVGAIPITDFRLYYRPTK